MSLLLTFAVILLCATPSFAGGVKIYTDLEFPDTTKQTSATVQGIPGIQGAQGDTGPQGLKGDKGDPALSVVDGNGKVLGTLVGVINANFQYVSNGSIYTIDTIKNAWAFPSLTFNFTTTNCTGTAYISLAYENLVSRQTLFTQYKQWNTGQAVYKVAGTLTSMQTNSRMSGPSGLDCYQSSAVEPLIPVVGVGLIPDAPVGPVSLQ